MGQLRRSWVIDPRFWPNRAEGLGTRASPTPSSFCWRQRLRRSNSFNFSTIAMQVRMHPCARARASAQQHSSMPFNAMLRSARDVQRGAGGWTECWRRMTRHNLLHRFGLGLVAVTVLISPVRTSAQVRDLMSERPPENRAIVWTGDLGMYLPLGSMVQDSMVRLRGVGTIKFGTRLTVPMRRGLAVEGSLAWSPSLTAQSDWKETKDLPGGVFLASVRARVRLYQDATGGTEVCF